jgi:hypothetical protein
MGFDIIKTSWRSHLYNRLALLQEQLLKTRDELKFLQIVTKVVTEQDAEKEDNLLVSWIRSILKKNSEYNVVQIFFFRYK